MPDLIQLTYSSVATLRFSQESLNKLLTQARNNNQSLGITGMLLYEEGSFFQVIEGAPETITALFEKIKQDGRHAQVTQIINEPIAKRDFADWTMGYSELSAQDADNIIGINDFFTRGKSFADIKSGRAKKLLQAFKTGRWRNTLSDNPGVLSKRSSDRSETVAINPNIVAPERTDYTFAYQPIVDAGSNKFFSYEVLIRGAVHEPASHCYQAVINMKP